jgi:hypothetical protein
MSFSKRLRVGLFFSLFILSASMAMDTTLVQIWGYVTDMSGKGIKGATVSLKNAGFSKTTDDTGFFLWDTLQMTPVQPWARRGSFATAYRRPVLKQDMLFFSVFDKTPQPVRIDVYNLSGRKVNELVNTQLGFGNYQVNTFAYSMPSQVYLLKTVIGNQVSWQKLPIVNRRNVTSTPSQKIDNTATVKPLAKTAALQDSIQVSMDGYTPESRPIEEYTGGGYLIGDTKMKVLSGTFYFVLRTPAQSSTKKLNISYNYSMGKDSLDPKPTELIAIWVESLASKYLNTIFVSKWHSTEGYRSNYLPEWRDSLQWATARATDSVHVDAISHASPNFGKHSFDYNTQLLNLEAGTYRFKFLTMIESDFRMLYSADIQLQGGAQEVKPSPTYIPSKHPTATVDALNSVVFSYK